MSYRRFLLLPIGLIVASGAARPADVPAGDITVTLTDSTVTRPGGATGVLAALLGGGAEKLKRGELTVDGETFALYLPRDKTCTVKNTGSGDGHSDNKSTAITVAAKGDEKLAAARKSFANLPLRIGDRMFTVVDLAADGSRIVLRPSNEPLRGVVLDRQCPEFKFETSDGKVVTRDRYKGRAFLLDIWSVT
jgi:hypothetical protein